MTTPRTSLLGGWLLLLASLLAPAGASDHADPMSINVFKLQEAPEANLTDLHAFLVDKDWKMLADGAPIPPDAQLVVSFCARRRLLPEQEAALNLKGYKFRVHFDLDPNLRIFDGNTAADGTDYAKELEKLAAAAEAKWKAYEDARSVHLATPNAETEATRQKARAEYDAANRARGDLVARRDLDRSMQALYGGIIPQPAAIAEDAALEFELDLVRQGPLPQAVLVRHAVQGMPDAVNFVTDEKQELKRGMLNVQAGIFDDPFIFPRFFRSNIVGVVTSIPLEVLGKKNALQTSQPILIWATTHGKNGEQIDHVGRSLRTQLPRFEYLNHQPPSNQVHEITRYHDQPGVLWDALATVVSPLFAHRHYDSAPDVMVYDLSKPAKFPNGRALRDDVAAALAAAGETLLVELSYSESRQFPRATTNDKPFREGFPFLASRWTADERLLYAAPGSVMDGFPVPNGPDLAAIAMPNLKTDTWRTLAFVLFAAIVVLFVLLWLAARTFLARLLAFILLLVALWKFMAVRAPNNPMVMADGANKLMAVIVMGGIATFLFGWWLYALGRRHGARKMAVRVEVPAGEQGLTEDDRQSSGSTFEEVRTAIFANPYHDKWSLAGRKPLPMRPVTFRNVAVGLFSSVRRFLLRDASQRTLVSRSDLRWGADGKGFRRMLHPNGICLVGKWIIDAAPPGVEYTGCFKPGTEVDVIARYSVCCGETRRGNTRSQSMVGKLFLGPGPEGKHTPAANFITQEDFGGAYSRSVNEVELRNAPDVSLWRKGKDLPSFLITALALSKADRKPIVRQLYEIAELGKPEGVRTNCPELMQLKVASAQPTVGGDDVDFRDEIMEQIYGDGTPEKKRTLTFNIAVSDTGAVTGFPRKTLKGAEWHPIGRMVFTEAVASYNGDCVIHFRHPPWRQDRNDPGVKPGPTAFWRFINRIFG